MSELAQQMTIRVENLLFDPQNPRLPSTMRGKGEAPVLKYMLDEYAVTDLMLSIAENGYYGAEPLLVVQSDQLGKFVVVEGNRRLAALKLLLNPDLAPVKQNLVREIASLLGDKRDDLLQVPATLYPFRSDIILYLGYRHVTGVYSWNTLAKARYLHELRIQYYGGIPDDEAYVKIAKTIGSRRDYVQKLLEAYSLYMITEHERFFGIRGLDEESYSFSLLTTALGYTNIRNFVKVDLDTELSKQNLSLDRLMELTDWVFRQNSENRTRLGESRNLSSLSAVVNSNVALQAFRDGTPLLDAEMLTDAPSIAFGNLLGKAEVSLDSAWQVLARLDKIEERHISKIKELNKMLGNIYRTAQAKFEATGFDEF